MNQEENKNIVEGVIELILDCDDPNDSNYGGGEYIDSQFLKKYNLQPGDRILFKKTNGKIEVVAKIHIKRTIEKIK